MVSIHEAHYHGLTISARPVPANPDSKGNDRYLYLTGKSNDLEVLIANKRQSLAEGKLALKVSYIVNGLDRPSIDAQIISVKLLPNHSQTFIITMNHVLEGQIVVNICDIGAPENHKNHSVDLVEKRAIDAVSGGLLCSYKVLDEVTYGIETMRFDQLQSQLKNLEKSLTTQMDQTILNRLSEMGIVGNRSLKSDVMQEKATGSLQEPAEKPKEPGYIG